MLKTVHDSSRNKHQSRVRDLGLWPNEKFPAFFGHVEGREITQPVATPEGNEQSKSNQEEKDHVVCTLKNLLLFSTFVMIRSRSYLVLSRVGLQSPGYRPPSTEGVAEVDRINRGRTNNIKEWMDQSMSSLPRVAEERRRWEAITAEASVGVPQRGLDFD